MRIAVITGASSGMGREFVKQLDAQNTFDEIWVIARRKDRLLSLADEVKAPIRPICLDLSVKESYDEYAALLAAEKPDVAILVNGSGFGRFGAFEDISLEDAIKAYEEGIKYYKECSELLEEASQKIETLTSQYRAQELHRNISVEGRIKPGNEKVYLIVETINEAINKERKSPSNVSSIT